MAGPIWNNNQHDDDDKVISFSFFGSRWFMITLSIAAGLLGIAILYYIFSSSNASYEEEVPVVEADSAPHKVKPDNPGGFQVPHQDKNIFEVVAKDNPADGEVTVLVPSEEKPLDGKMVFVENTPRATAGQVIAPVEEISPVSEEVIAAPVATVTEEIDIIPIGGHKEKRQEHKHPHKKHSLKDESPEGEKLKEEKEITTSKAETHEKDAAQNNKTAKEHTPKKEKKATGKFMVQLASMQSKANADEEWKKLKSKNADLFKGLINRVEKKHVEGKGIFFRLHTGPFSTKAEASAFCAKLKERNLSCFPV